MRALWIILAFLVGIVVLVLIGLRIQPRPLAPVALKAGSVETVALPHGLPEPATRFYETLYGQQVPLVESVIISGRATMRINGIRMPARYRFTHQAGEGYRHYIEATWFGLPMMQVNEWFVEGHGRMELPFGVSEGLKIDQGANLALWAEAAWFPSLWVTDSRVEWTSVDDDTALMSVPWGEEREVFVVRVDPETGLLQMLESMRYKGEEATVKTLWLNEVLAWDVVDGQMTSTESAVTWIDDGEPWAIFGAEEMVLNADVSQYLLARGE